MRLIWLKVDVRAILGPAQEHETYNRQTMNKAYGTELSSRPATDVVEGKAIENDNKMHQHQL